MLLISADISIPEYTESHYQIQLKVHPEDEVTQECADCVVCMRVHQTLKLLFLLTCSPVPATNNELANDR